MSSAPISFWEQWGSHRICLLASPQPWLLSLFTSCSIETNFCPKCAMGHYYDCLFFSSLHCCSLCLCHPNPWSEQAGEPELSNLYANERIIDILPSSLSFPRLPMCNWWIRWCLKLHHGQDSSDIPLWLSFNAQHTILYSASLRGFWHFLWQLGGTRMKPYNPYPCFPCL